MLLIGESDERAGTMLAESYKNVCESKPYYAHMSIISAEITKISLNSYITMKISFANTLARICEAIPGSDVDQITKALGADRRISPFYLKGGLSYGGPCFPRDNRAFAAFASAYGIDTDLAKTTDRVNQSNIEHVAKRIIDILHNNKSKKVAILGLSYKPDTCVIEESPAIKLIDELLKKEDIEIIVYDSLAMDNTRAMYGDKIIYASSMEDCLAEASLGIVTTQAKDLKTIDSSIIHSQLTIIDCWRQLDPSRLGTNVKYVPLGKWQ
jgi:UDPglucose 6-dehydrogenase